VHAVNRELPIATALSRVGVADHEVVLKIALDGFRLT
jgi:hypothetical protein